MPKRLAGVPALVLILVLTASTALAGNYCVSLTSGSSTGEFELEGFSAPGKGKCKSVIGFFETDFNEPVSGAVCTSTNGENLTITVSGSALQAGGEGFIGSATLSLPGQTGTYYEVDLSSSSVLNAGNPWTAKGATCAGTTIAEDTDSGSTPRLHGLGGLP